MINVLFLIYVLRYILVMAGNSVQRVNLKTTTLSANLQGQISHNRLKNDGDLK